MSRVDIDDQVLEVFGDMKLRSTHKHAIFRIEKKKVIVDSLGEHKVTHTKKEDEVAFGELTSLLKDTDHPRYILYDFEFPEEEEGRKYKKLAFIFWCPETCKLGVKMIYIANRAVLLRQFPGVVEFQTNDPADLDYAEYLYDIKHKASTESDFYQ